MCVVIFLTMQNGMVHDGPMWH